MVTVNEITVECPDSPSYVAVTITVKFIKGEIPVHIKYGSNAVCVNIKPAPAGDVKISTVPAICRFLARVCTSCNLYGQTPLEKTQVDHWIEFSNRKYTISEFKQYMKTLDQALKLNTYLVGHDPSLADICVWSSLFVNKQWHNILAEHKAPMHVSRWYNHLKSLDNFAVVLNMFPELVEEVVANSKETKTGKTEDVGKFVELPDAEMGKVMVRFPPEASGYLHIGHAKAALLNAYYQKVFQGKLIMRFDDTNPEKEKEDFEKVILEDVSMLQIEPDIFTYTSDYFDLMLQKCEDLIKCGLAYVDDTDSETMKLERDKKVESKNRSNDVQKNLSLWEEMKKGSDYGKQCCVRAKIDMQSDNGCLRDPTIYRCKTVAHPRTGNKFNVYPTYDFACPIVDSIEGVTHALRTTEYHDRDDQYFWFLEKMKLRKLHIYEYSRLNMTHTVLSKRKLTWFVEQGIVDGWDDPRMPTVRGVLRRGMTVEGLKQFIVAQGSSRSVVVMEWDKIWAFNKKIIDPIAPRYNAVETEDKVLVLVEGAENGTLEVPKHPKNQDMGMKTIHVGPRLYVDCVDAEAMHVGENVTFINWGNLLINDVKKNSDGKIETITAKLNLENKDYKKTLKVTWVCATESAPLIPCGCVYYDHLVSKSVLGKDEDFKDFLNDNTKIVVMMEGDPDLAFLKKGDIIQIQRKGFFICDEPYDDSTLRYISRASPVILLSIPDGSKDVSTLPRVVKSLRTTRETSKEAMNRKKGKLAEKSPQEEEKSFSAPMDISSNVDSHGTNEIEILGNQIREQGDKVRIMKSQNASKEQLKPEIDTLLKLKLQYKALAGKEWKPVTSEQKANKIEVKADLGSKDVGELDQQIKMRGDKIRMLKSQNLNKDQLKPEIDALLALKSEYKKLTGKEWKPQTEESKPQKRDTTIESNSDCVVELDNQIKVQGDKIRILKSENCSKDQLKPEIDALLKLKSEYKKNTGKEWKPSVADEPNTQKREAKTDSNLENIAKLDQQIKIQGDKIRTMKSQNANKDEVKPEIDALLKLKTEYKKLTGKEWKPVVTDDQKPQKKINEKVEPVEETGKTSEKVLELDCQIKAQGDKIRCMKSEKASKESLKPEINALLALKANFKNLTSKDWTPNVVEQQAETNNCSSQLDNNNLVSQIGDSNLSSQIDTNILVSEMDTSNSSSHNPSPSPKAKKSKIDKNPKEKETKEDESDSNIKKVTRLGMEAKKEENLAEWYSQVITKGEMIEYYDVSGCYILRPWAYGIWEFIVQFFDPAIKALGVSNSYFPMFVSPHALEREKTHIADFAPEVAWVTKSGDSDLAEPIAIRPTSETVMYPSYAKWIRSHRDLPLKLNQWCSVVRWEFKNPQPFLRTREFLWQEGHTAFATREEAVEEVYTILGLYAEVYESLLAIPVVRGQKTEKEKFAGADFTTTVEAFVAANGRAIQGATSHHLGQNFSKMFEIIFENPETNEKCFAFQNSWGLTTRTIGVMVMVHADNMGLVLPPRVAVYQVVIVPCGITANLSDTEKVLLMDKCKEFESCLKDINIRVKGDYRDNVTPGWKYNYWELKGVPIRVELGPRDIKKNQFVAVRRDTGEKTVLPFLDGANLLKQLLDEIHNSMYAKAKREMDEHLVVATNWDDFCTRLDNKCIIQAPFCGEIPCEDKIKKDSARNADDVLEPGAPSMGAKGLCIPFVQPSEITPDLKCIHPACESKPKYFTLFGRSY